MSDKNRSYRQEMDALRVSEQKAQETLDALLSENERLENKKTRPIYLHPALYAVAAACLALAVLAANLLRGGFPGVRIGDLPAVTVARGDEETALEFSQAFGLRAAALFPGAQVREDKTVSFTLNGQTLHRGELTLLAAGHPWAAQVTDYEPPLYTALTGGDPRFARGSDTGLLYALWRQEGRYILLSAQGMEEKDFEAAVRGIMAK